MVPKPTDEKQTNFPGNQYSLILFETADKINQEIHIEHPSPLSAQIQTFKSDSFHHLLYFSFFHQISFRTKTIFFKMAHFQSKTFAVYKGTVDSDGR